MFFYNELKKKQCMLINFEGRRYDVGDKFGFLQATVEYELRKTEIKDDFINDLKNII